MPRKNIVIDTEFHHIPWVAAMKAKDLPDGDLKFKRIVSNPDAAYGKVFNIETCIRHMDECGLDMAAVGLATWDAASMEVCRTINDELSGYMDRYPGRFIPLAHIPYLDGQSAIDELDRAINDLGLKGVTLLTSLRGARLDDKQLRPLFKKIEKLQVPVVVHPTVKIPIWGGDRYYMSGSVSREYDIIKAFVEVLCGVLPEYPELTFIFSHYGGGAPFLLGRIMSFYLPENTDIPKELIAKPKTYRQFEKFGLKKRFNKLLDRVYFNIAGTGGWMPAFKQALLAIRPERLCFGSDYPWEMSTPSDLKAYLASIKRSNIPKEDKKNILGGNMLRLFKV
ncbi:MAG: amidohydrolase [Deltaproteobacteria bacterium]|nr:amidohydrolase [Deltaproteobacteria bacterium]